MRALKGLEGAIGVSVVHWLMREQGWTFAEGPGTVPDTVNNAAFLHQVYTAADSRYTGRVTVPVLWDKRSGTIVSNESSEIIRMLDSAFDCVGAKPGDHYPEPLRPEIDAVNDLVYDAVNNGVYRAGFATKQAAYEEAVTELFDALDRWEELLGRRRYLCGDPITEADWAFFTTLVRFDPVYHGHFKCNLRRIVDYPNLWGYLRDLYQQPGVAETVDLDHIRRHYYGSHESINPTRIVPKGPIIDLSEAHDRGRLSS
jgi:putative glutathione S-transferase